MKVTWLAVGLIATTIGCAQMMGKKEKDEDEVKMSLSEVPPAVRNALNREAGGAQISDVERETEDGRTIYEANVTSGGKTWDIKVDENGKVIGKEVEDEGEKEGNDDKED
jgi:uncharacterized membrane protein YkoI